MLILKIIIWFVAILSAAIFCKYWLFPFLKIKWLLYKGSYNIRKMAKENQDPETKEKLNEIADLFDQMNKEEKLGGDDGIDL